MNTVAAVNHCRSIWISDIRFGTRGCKAEFLLDFLKHNESDYLYLVGDIIDCWRLKRAWFWQQAHNDVVQKMLRKAHKRTHIVYAPGNHDEPLRDYTGMQFGGVAILEETIHVTADGWRLLVLHGDKFDVFVKHARWLAILGNRAYNLILEFNHWYNVARHHLGYPYWSLSAYIKGRVKDAVRYVDEFEIAIAEERASAASTQFLANLKPFP